MHNDTMNPDNGDPGIPIHHYRTIAERLDRDAGDADRRRAWQRRNSRRGASFRTKGAARKVKS